MNTFVNVLAALEELEQDASAPKNVKSKVSETIKLLQVDEEPSTKASKALSTLERLTEDCNMQSHIRTQLFNIVSLLEVL